MTREKRLARFPEQEPVRPWHRVARRAGLVLLAAAGICVFAPWLPYGVFNAATGNSRFRSRARMPVSVAARGEMRTTFEVSERGPYSAIIAVSPFRERYWPRSNDSLPFTVKIRIDAGGRTVSRTIERSGHALYGKEGESIVLADFDVPTDFPARTEGTVTFTVIHPSEDFERRYGPLLFYMMLMSDY